MNATKLILASITVAATLWACVENEPVSMKTPTTDNLLVFDERVAKQQPDHNPRFIEQSSEEEQLKAYRALMASEVFVKDRSGALKAVKLEDLVSPSWRPNCTNCDANSNINFNIPIDLVKELVNTPKSAYLTIRPSIRGGNLSPILSVRDTSGELITQKAKSSKNKRIGEEEINSLDNTAPCPPLRCN